MPETRRCLVVGNWKMNHTHDSSIALASGIARHVTDLPRVDVVICPPHVYLHAVSEVASESRLQVGAQNVFYESSGAFTGETSAKMLADVACRYVIVGHRERRRSFGETDEETGRRALAALSAGLTPIICVGETLDDRRGGRISITLREQLVRCIASIPPSRLEDTVIAYQPETRTRSPEEIDARESASVLVDVRGYLSDITAPNAFATRTIVEGAIRVAEAQRLVANESVDGLLLDEASIDADLFLSVASAVNEIQ